MPNENNQNIMETNPSFLDTNKKVLFNINWDLNAGGVRQLEIDAFKCLNSNVNALGTWYSPIDGTTTKGDVTLFFARKRMILLLDIWNRILNSGLFNEARLATDQLNTYYKIVGSNVRQPVAEYLIKANNISGTFHYPLTLDTVSIFNRIQRFLTAYVNNYNWFVINNISRKELFPLTTTNAAMDFAGSINIYHNPTKPSMMALIEELVTLYKSLLDETKITSKVDLGFNFDNLTFLTEEGRANILKLDAYKSNYNQIARIDTSYLNDETKVLVQEWIDTNSNKLTSLYPQFGTLISRNTESETWNFRNVAIDTTPYNPLDLNPALDPMYKPYQTKYLLCSQLDMKRPLVFDSQFINWANDDDKPYVMLYNGGTLIYIPDEVKEATHPITFVEKEATFPDITIANNYVDLPQLETGTYYMEFDLIMGSTNYTYDRKLFGPSTADGASANGLILGGASPYSLYFGIAGSTPVINPTYANINAKLKIVNGINDNSCKVYINDELKATFTGRYDFASIQRFGSSADSRKVGQAEIKNIKTKSFTGNVQEEAPDNQLNLAAYFWKIGTSNNLDPNYNKYDDIKLKLPDGKNLYDIDKLDFLDNLTIYLKLN